MTTLYVTSTETFSGKSALCVGLAKRLQQDGYTIGYLKPVSVGVRPIDEDAAFFKETFHLPDPPQSMVAMSITPRTVESIVQGKKKTDFAAVLQTAYGRVAAGRDLVILEGGANLREGQLIGLPAPEIARMLHAQSIVVVKYNEDLQLLDDALAARASLGDMFAGVVLNAVPRQRMPFVQELCKPMLEARGIPVLAVLPQERLLLSVSVGELAEFLSGKILCCADKADELVEHLMVGAMSVDSALAYFRRKPNKAVITGGDRADIQLAALETSTKCLILTGNLQPSPIILGRAEEVGVPMILVRQDTLTTVEVIERFFGRTRFHLERKVDRFVELLSDRFDFPWLYAHLGLAAAEQGSSGGS